MTKTWNDYPPVLTPAEAAELLRLSRVNTITDKCRAGELPAFKATGKAWRIDRDRLRLMFAPKMAKNQSLADQLGEIELALSTLATVHRDEDEAEALRAAHGAALAAYNQARESQK